MANNAIENTFRRRILEHASDYLHETGGCQQAQRLLEMLSDAALYAECGNAALDKRTVDKALNELGLPTRRSLCRAYRIGQFFSRKERAGIPGTPAAQARKRGSLCGIGRPDFDAAHERAFWQGWRGLEADKQWFAYDLSKVQR